MKLIPKLKLISHVKLLSINSGTICPANVPDKIRRRVTHTDETVFETFFLVTTSSGLDAL